MTKATSDITADSAYDAVAPDNFAAMIEVDRYANRSGAFDKIISATHDHFWDPMDPKYVDFSQGFDLENEPIMPLDFNQELRTAVADKLDEGQKIQLVNMNAHWSLSSILHGEQGALSLSASLCHILLDPGAQEYAANQTREEARHVTAFSNYVHARWGKPLAFGENLSRLIADLVHTPLVWKKIVGMQMVIEGLAMGTFSVFYSKTNDPVLKRMTQLVMTDEAFHHKFGKIWADRTIPNLDEEQRAQIEDWAWETFKAALFNATSPDQKKEVYARFGLDWKWVQGAVNEAMTDKAIRSRMNKDSSVFRVLVKTLVKAGIVTERTAPYYAAYVDVEELHKESDRMIGDDIADRGIEYLKQINAGLTPGQIAAE